MMRNRDNINDIYSLTPMQEGILFHWIMDKISTVYFEQMVIALRGYIDPDLFAGSFRQMIEKYDILRTIFLYDKIKKPLQVLLKENTSQTCFEDISHLGEEEAGKYLEDFKKKDREQGFDLSKDCMIRAALFRTGQDHYRLVLSFHHVIMDGWSSGILFQDLIRVYQRLKNGESLNREPEPVTPYREYIHWLERQDREQGLKYWRDYLDGYEHQAVLPIRGIHTKNKSSRYQVEEYLFTIDQSISAGIREIVREHRVTIPIVFRAIWGILLQGYNNTDDVVFGTVVSGRPPEIDGIEDMVGLFINSIPVRVRVQTGEIITFSRLISIMHQDAVLSKAYEYLPLSEIQANSLLKGQLIDHSMGFQNYPIQEKMNGINNQDDPGFKVKGFESFEQTNYNFNCIASFAANECFVLRFNYNALIYEIDLLKRVALHFRQIAAQVTADHDIAVNEIELITGAEKKQLIEVFNNTNDSHLQVNTAANTLHRLFEDQVVKNPDNIAVCSSEVNFFISVSYAELDQRSNRLANYLVYEKNISVGEGVGLLLNSSIDLAVAVLAVLKAGGAYIPLNPLLPENRIRGMIRDTRLGVVISQRRYIRLLNRLQWDCDSFHSFLLLDSWDVYAEKEVEKSGLMDRKLWEYIGESAVDDITGGGWISSYTGESFTAEEMDEYGDNILRKLKPILSPQMRVLEIGCASGISMFRLAPHVGFYFGTDLSRSIIARNRERVKLENHKNIDLAVLAAHEIDTIKHQAQAGFDIIIMNSVVQAFHGHNYLRQVIKKAVDLLASRGWLFIGDVMDLELKKDLVREMKDFKRANLKNGKNYKTKTDYSEELFISRSFFQDLGKEITGIKKIEFSNKIYTIENELTKFRFDVYLTIDKPGMKTPLDKKKNKYQQDLRALENLSTGNVPAQAKPGDPAYMIYTSGSTGIPKGVIVTHGSAVNAILFRKHQYGMNPGVISLQLFSYSFDGFVTGFFTPIISGARQVFLGDDRIGDTTEIRNAIIKNRVTHFISVPALYRAIIHDLDKVEAASLKVVTLAGDILHPELLDFSRRVNPRLELTNEYGITEAAVMSTLYRHQERNNHIKIGHPICNTEIFIMDHAYRLQPVGVTGELCISGKGLARGYLNNPELTVNRFCLRRPGGRFFKKLPPWSRLTPRKNFCLKEVVGHDVPPHREQNNQKLLRGSRGWFSRKEPPGRRRQERVYLTGDLARWLDDGNIEFLGRSDGQVKVRGFRIEIGEIENSIERHEAVRDAVVVLKEGPGADRCLCAYITGVPGESLDTHELKEYLAHLLPGYMVPAYFVLLEHIPMTASGKVDRKALPEPGIGRAAREYEAPRNEVEEKLVEIWRDVLNISPGGGSIGIKDNFFDLGGHSLKATILVSRVRKAFDIEFPLKKVFDGPTIAAMAEFIKKSGKSLYEEIVPMEKREYYPQSSAQKRLFFLDQFETVGTAYNMSSMVKIAGEPDSEGYEKVFNVLIARHEALRTSFHLQDNEPVQKVHESVEFKIKHYDLAANPETANKSLETHHFSAMIHLSFIRTFDLGRAPLLRVGITVLAPGAFFLLFDMHHIIGDGTSMQVLISDFLSMYESEALAPVKIQYKDFSCWQNHLLKSGRLRATEEFWFTIFSDAPDIPRLDLPLDYPRPVVFDFAGDDYYFKLGPGDTQRFKEAGAEPGATLFMKLLAAFNILLFKYTGQEDIIIGCDIAGRPHADLQEVVGMFVNELAMRNFPLGNKTFPDFLKEVKDNCIRAFENQDLQFEELVDKLSLQRDPSRNPLFDVEFAFQNFERSTVMKDEGIDIDDENDPVPAIEEVSSAPGEIKSRTAKFDIALDASEQGEGISFRLQYCTQLFKSTTIERLAGHFVKVLREIGHNPGIRLADIFLLSENEKQQVLFDFNYTKRDFPGEKCYHCLFEEQVQKTPDQVALVGPMLPITHFQDNAITYKELNRQSDQLCNYLFHEKNIRLDDRVGILMDRSVEFLVSIVGIMKAGAAYVPLDTNWPLERIKAVIDDAGIEVVISGIQCIRDLDRLQWECDSFHTYVLLDMVDDYSYAGVGLEAGAVEDSEELWEYIGETAEDEITEGGWISSYTGQPFSKAEMDEYGDNILKKMKSLLHSNMRVLEIGCASGITMYRLAPHVGFYYGTDISRVTIRKNRERIQKEKHENISIAHLAAHEIQQIDEKDFDLIILNSVVQSFYGHGYLRDVLRQVVDLANEKARIFVGDVMDLELKDRMISDLMAFKQANRDKGYKTKIDFSAELFIPRGFFEDLLIEVPGIQGVEFSDKIYTIENELTRFRYDALLIIDKTRQASRQTRKKHNYQHDLSGLEKFSTIKIKVEGVESGAGPDNLAYIIYTSGTTGKPKGVMIHQRGMINHIFAKINDLGLGGTDIVAQTASTCFDISVWQFLAGLLVGGQILVIGRETVLEPVALLKTLQTGQVTIFETVPSLMTGFLEMVKVEKNNRLDNLRWMIPTGEALTPSLVRQWYEVYPGVKLVNAYGPTEASDDVSHYIVNQIPGDSQQTIPIGRPIQNTHIYILDKSLALCPIGVRGEICIAGIGVGKGYWKDEEKTRKSFIANPFLRDIGDIDYSMLYKTGDIGYCREDGLIECLGRLDFQVKIRGNRIELGEIESRLKHYDGIKDAVVIDREDKNNDKYLCAYIVPVVPHHSADFSGDGSESGMFDITGLREYLALELPGYMIPSFFVCIEKIPLTSNGKLDRKSLPDPQTGTGIEAHAIPMDETEKKLASVWAEVLNISQGAIGPDTDFFEIGGHSLKATGMASAVHRELGVKVPIAEVFKTSTLRGLAAFIKGANTEAFIAIEPVEEKEFYEVSASQKRMYILNLFMEYNIPLAMVIESEIDKNGLEKVFQELIKRHESLRTSFVMQGEEPVQRIHKHRDVGFKIEYFQGNSRAEIEETVNRFFHAFDLSKAPLMRVGLIQLSENRHIFLFNIHHIVSDGLSMGVLAREVGLLNTSNELPVLKTRYRDFSHWQNQLFRAGEYKKQEAYWLNRFRGEIPVLNMPVDYPRPVMQNFEGRRVRFEIAGETFRALKVLALKKDVSHYMVVLAVYNILLSRYTGQDDIVIGTITAGRDRQELENLIGVFINALAMRNYPVQDKTFSGFLKELRQDTLDAYENHLYPFGDLLEKVVKKKDVSRSPLFDVMLIFQNFDMGAANPGGEGVEAEGIRTEPYRPEQEQIGHAQHDITLWANEEEKRIIVEVEYCTALFRHDSIERFAGHFLNILKGVIDKPGLRLFEIEMIGEVERQQILEQFNDTAVEFPAGKTIHEMFRGQVRRTPDHIALVGKILKAGGEDVFITYGELNRMSDRIAHILSERGIHCDCAVGIMFERCVEMTIGIMGILKAGGAYLPIDPDLPVDRIQYMLLDSAAGVLVSNRTLVEGNKKLKILEKEIEGIFFDALDWVGSSWEVEGGVGSGNLSYIIYTSGSTGRSKGVMVQHSSFVNAAYAWGRDYRLQEMEVNLLQMAGFSFDVFAGDIARALLFGGKLVICPGEVRLDLDALYGQVRDQRITIFESTPALIVPFMDYVRAHVLPINHLKLLILGSDICLVEDYNRLLLSFGNEMRIINSYGVTEAAIDTSYYESPSKGEQPAGNVPIGKPMPNMRFYIMNMIDSLQPIGIPGELYIGGKGVARGYINHVELTNQRFTTPQSSSRFTNQTASGIPAPNTVNKKLLRGVQGGSFHEKRPPGRRRQKLYRTGDLACWRRDGSVEFLGRADHQVKIRGFRIELGEIENQLLNYDEIKEAVVMARGDEISNRYLCAYFVGVNSNREIDIKKIKEYLMRELPGYMAPAYFIRLERLPLAPGGKVDRRALPEPERGRGASVGDYVPAGDELERQLVEIWAGVLNVSFGVIGIDDNFFDLGGHSLRAVQVSAGIHRLMNIKISIAMLFTFPTVRRLAGYIREEVGVGRIGEVYSAIEALEWREYYPLSRAQQRLWTLSQMEGASLTFNMQEVYIIEGELGGEAFARAIHGLLDRHESLRTVFLTVNSQPVQRIRTGREIGFQLEQVDLRGRGDVESLIREWVRIEAGTLFDLVEGPLWRVKLTRVEEQKYVFLLTLHHIIGDAVSIQVFFEELLILYNGYRQGRGNVLGGLAVQYKDYAAWQNSRFREKGEILTRHRDYWLSRLHGSLPVLQLPPENQRPERVTYRGSNWTIHIDQELTSRLKSVSREYDVSLFMTLLTAIKLLLYRYTGQTDIILGTTIDGREHSDLRHQIGFYINTLALRTRFNPRETLAGALAKVRDVTLAAFEHQEYPFDMLVEDLGIQRDSKRHPVFEVVVDMINFPGEAVGPGVEMQPLSITSFDPGYNQSKFDLTIFIFEDRDAMDIRFEYKVDLFEPVFMKHMARRLRELLNCIVTEPLRTISEVEMDWPLEFAPILPGTGMGAPIPASYHQERLWFLDQFEGGNPYETNPVYHNVPLILKIKGEVSREKLERAIREVIRRHGALRTRIITVDSKPYQWIGEEKDIGFRLEHRQLESTTAAGFYSEAVLMELVQAEAGRPFFMDKQALIRGMLFEISGQESLLVIIFHHAVVDRYSMKILVREILTCYAAYVENRMPGLGSLPLQYTDFSQWQRNFSEDVSEAMLFYWRNRLRGGVPVLELPTDRPRAAVHRFRAGREPFVISEAQVSWIRRFCEHEHGHIRVFTFLLAVFNILLCRFTGQEEIVVGAGAVNRDHAGSEGIVGPVANLLVLRNYIHGFLPFTKIVAHVARTVDEAYKYGDIPFDRLVSELKPRQDMSRNAFFDVLFRYEDIPGDTLFPLAEGCDVEVVETSLGWGKYDLNLLIQDKGNGFAGILVYNALYYNDSTIRDFIDHYRELLVGVLESPGCPVGRIDFITDRQREYLLFSLNRTGVDFPWNKTIWQLFGEQVERIPDHTGLVGGKLQVTNYKTGAVGGEGSGGCDDVQVSYGELNERAHQLACFLNEKGVEPGTIVAIMVERSLEMILGILAILKAGGAYLPIGPGYPAERVLFMLADSAAGILLTTGRLSKEKQIGGVEGLRCREIVFLDSLDFLNDLTFSSFGISNGHSADLAYIIYTSGTTGRPKGVMIGNGAVVNRLHWMQRFYPIDEGDVILQKTPYTFDVSVWELFWWGLTGASVCLLGIGEEKDPAAIINAIEKHRITTMHFVPSMLNVFLNYLEVSGDKNWHVLSGLRQVFSSGEVLTGHPVQRFYNITRTFKTKLINLYGPTEATVDVTYFNCPDLGLGEEYPHAIPIGKPIDNINIYILDSNSGLQPGGVVGELCISGIGLARGYLNTPELTSEKFPFFPYEVNSNKKFYGGSRGAVFQKSPPGRRRRTIYKTGDRARWLLDGNIEFLGRVDHQVKVRGIRIEPGEIESCLLSYEGIKEAVVVMKESKRGDKSLCAYVVPENVNESRVDQAGLSIDVAGLRAHLAGVLPGYMIPDYFIPVVGFPLSPNGKLDYKALPGPQPVVKSQYQAPRDEVEKKLAKIWEEVLSIRNREGESGPGIDDHFFEVGGHSLRAALLTAQIHRVFDVRLQLGDVFKAPSIRGLAAIIKSGVKERYVYIEAVEWREYYPLSTTQRGVFLHQQLKADSIAYNSVQYWNLEGELETGKFRETIKRLIRRHESFRTGFLVLRGEPVQRVFPAVEFEIEYVELPSGNADVRSNTGKEESQLLPADAQLAEQTVKEFIRPFDLSQAPLLRVELVKTFTNRYILVLDMHHIITDGVSQEIFVRDFMLLYENHGLPLLRVQYKDYAVWLKSETVIEKKREQEKYWCREFSGEIPVLHMPADFKRPDLETFAGEMLTFSLQQELSEKLQQMAKERDVTLFMVLLAAYYILLSQYSGQEDMVVGSPVTGRRHMDLPNIMGMFVNMLALRNRPEAGKSVNVFLKEVKETVVRAVENQDFHFEELVTVLGLQGKPGRNPLFDVVFAMQNVDIEGDRQEILPDRELSRLILTPYEFQHEVSQFDLILGAFQDEKTIILNLRYATTLYRASTAEKILHRYVGILEQIAGGDDLTIGDIAVSHELLSADSGIIEEDEEDEFEF